LELLLPLKDSRACGGGLSLGDLAAALQGDGQRGVGERIVGGEGCQSHCSGDGVVECAGIAQGADQPMMSLNVARISGDGGAKSLGRFRRLALCEQVEATVGVRVGGVRIGHG
jgi:hypothetical protein